MEAVLAERLKQGPDPGHVGIRGAHHAVACACLGIGRRAGEGHIYHGGSSFPDADGDGLEAGSHAVVPDLQPSAALRRCMAGRNRGLRRNIVAVILRGPKRNRVPREPVDLVPDVSGEDSKMKIAVAGDAAGQPLVHVLHAHLGATPGLDVEDASTPEDGMSEYYADHADRVAGKLLAGEFDRAILVCGTGIGMCISANKVPGVRATLTHDTYSARRAALSNNAQIITMGARVIGPELAKDIAETWLAETFDRTGPSARNVAAINVVDAKYSATK